MTELPIQTLPSLTLSCSWSRPSLVALKRLVDIIVSTFLLTLLSPVFLLLSAFIKVTSRGPIFYKWHVVGVDATPFIGYKFRSMVVNADQLKSQLMSSNEMSGPVFKMKNDPRITSVGRWMRRYSLDELPQLYNVLKGDMALVGPRPPLVDEYREFNEYQKQKLAVKPGLTCLWQISGRNDVSNFDEWVRLDLEYIRRWSLWLD